MKNIALCLVAGGFSAQPRFWAIVIGLGAIMIGGLMLNIRIVHKNIFLYIAASTFVVGGIAMILYGEIILWWITK